MTIEETILTSSFDGSPQPVAFVRAGAGARPLLAALHSWSGGCEEDIREEYFRRATDHGWNCVFPHFRGPNNHPGACGSQAALRDILDAVEWASDTFRIDHRRIFLAGAGGGGHMVLQLAGFSPASWTAASAWNPIADLAVWYRETAGRGIDRYTLDLERVCGGPPGASAAADTEYRQRSPLPRLWRAHIVPVDIAAGVRSGIAGSIPVGHAIRAYNELVRAADRPHHAIPGFAADRIDREGTVPSPWAETITVDAGWTRSILLRAESGLSRLTIFDGGEEMLFDAAFSWFDRF